LHGSIESDIPENPLVGANVCKDLKFKARTKDCNFVLKDSQGPRTKAKDNIPG